MEICQFADTLGLACGDQLIPSARASNGFEDGLAAGVCGDICIADHKAYRAALPDMAKRAIDRSEWREADYSLTAAKNLFEESWHAQADLDVSLLYNDALDDSLQKLRSVRGDALRPTLRRSGSLRKDLRENTLCWGHGCLIAKRGEQLGRSL